MIMNKKKGLLQTYRIYIFIPVLIVGIILISAIVLFLIYSFTQSIAPLIVLAVIATLTLGSYIVFFIRANRKLSKTFYHQLYETTVDNLNKIKNNDTNLSTYGQSDIKEIQKLDEITESVKSKLDSAYLIVKSPDYSAIDLEYVGGRKDLITYRSFRKNLQNIIFVSQSYRNVIIDVFYDMPDESDLTDADRERIFELYRNVFAERESVLFCFAEKEPSMLIYIPTIDSFKEIEEKLNYAVTSSSVMVRDAHGIRNIKAKYAVVAYPFSSEEMLLGDLKYAKSKNEDYILYLPKRIKSNAGANLLINTTMNLNYCSKLLDVLSGLDYSAVDNEKNEALLKDVFESISGFLDYDEAGVIAYDEERDEYYSYANNSRSTIFKNRSIRRDFVNLLADTLDDDNMYLFSSRKHANANLQQTLGLYGIQSGIYYVIRNFDDDGVNAIVYIFNRNKDMVINSYLRETFLMVSLRIQSYFEKRHIADYADAKDTENQNILALNNMFVYHIDTDNRITYLSKGFKKAFPKAKVGEKCHLALYGLERRCANCPLVSKTKMYFERKGEQYETSGILSDRKDDDRVILVRRVYERDTFGDLYQDDFLTYSFKALVTAIQNEYLSGGRGYVLLLSIDNYAEIVKKLGSEGYSYLIRDYIRSIKNKLGIDDVYYYNASALVVHFPFIGHKDIITKIEEIYPLSKADYYKGDDFSTLNISYLASGYPRGYAHAEDYMKHMSDIYHNPSFARNKDYIYFSDMSIERSASKREFMLSVLESEFSGHNSTAMNLQPIVQAKDGHIYGAEILLRIADEHRGVFFNAMEISRIAEQEEKTGMITESIINFIGSMYKEYGNNVFKINNFRRIAINIDRTYLGNDEIVRHLIALCVENALPNGFVSLEIPEDLVPENQEKIKTLAKTLSKYKIMFSCDRYTGQYTSIDELASLGFNEIKIARDLILNIVKDQTKYHEVQLMVESAKKDSISVAAVGVENEQQFKMLRELDEDMMVQGYYLYKPLAKSDLITALISYKD